MKILSRQAFMKLPAGTIYNKGTPWFFGSLTIKGETCVCDGKNIDWLEISPDWVEADSTEQAIDRFDDMLTNGTSYPMCSDIGRDGCFDEGEIFMIYERDDLERLRGFISEAIFLVGGAAK